MEHDDNDDAFLDLDETIVRLCQICLSAESCTCVADLVMD